MTATLTTYATVVTTPRAAAARIARYMIERYELDDQHGYLPTAYGPDRTRDIVGPTSARACVVWESCEAYEWALDTHTFYEACAIDRSKVFLEPQTGCVLCVYRQVG